MSIKIYGIANCDTMKKARNWLKDHDVQHEFHDYKKSGIEQKTLKAWCKQCGYEVLLNRRGTTWRKLSAADQADIDENKAVRLMAENPSLIKRPVLDTGSSLLVGFSESDWQSLL